MNVNIGNEKNNNTNLYNEVARQIAMGKSAGKIAIGKSVGQISQSPETTNQVDLIGLESQELSQEVQPDEKKFRVFKNSRKAKIGVASLVFVASLGAFTFSQTSDANIPIKPITGIENLAQKTNPVVAIAGVAKDAPKDAPATDAKEDTIVPEVVLPIGSVVLNTSTPKISITKNKSVEDTAVAKVALPVESVVVNTPTQITKPVENKDTSSVDKAVADKAAADKAVADKAAADKAAADKAAADKAAASKAAADKAAADKAAASKTVATTVLTPQIITRLQSYPYYQKKPVLDFNQIMEKRPDQAAGIVKNIFEEFNLFKAKEKFITNERLTYRTWQDHYVIRGILQITLENGDITEQDVEYQYYYGGLDGPKFVFEEMRTLSGKKSVK